MKAIVILNAFAGSITASEASATVSRVRGAFEEAHLAAEVLAIRPEGLLEAARAAAPLGSLNHFARDLGIPLDLDQAVRTIATGRVTEVDVGEVNGRIFLNNSSIGLYPSAVAQREELRHRQGGGKWPAMLNACVDVVRRFPLLDVILRSGEGTVAMTTPFVFVGNNRYEMSLLSMGTRTSLQGGELSIYLTRDAGRMGLLRLFFRALLGRLEQDLDFHSVVLPAVEIRTRRRFLWVSLDGEVVRMASPIRYLIRPLALRVLVPAPTPGGAGA
jgi:diacylglycerol kinase family enzyme